MSNYHYDIMQISEDCLNLTTYNIQQPDQSVHLELCFYGKYGQHGHQLLTNQIH